MATLTVQNAAAGLAGVSLVAAAGGGDAVPQGSKGAGWALGVLFIARNDDATPTTVTVAGVGPFAVPAGGTCVVPVFGIYKGALRAVTYSKVTALTVGAVAL